MSKSKVEKPAKVKLPPAKVKLPVSYRINQVIRWVDRTILPFVSVVGLAGFAVVGLMELLPNFSENARLIGSIIVVAYLLVKTKA